MENESRKTLSDVVDQLVENVYNILNWRYIAAVNQTPGTEIEANGLPKGYYNFDHVKLEQLVRIVEPLLKDAQATRKVEAQSSKDIIKLIANGKISFDEAFKLMSLMKIKLEIEEKEEKRKLQKAMMGILSGSSNIDEEEEEEEEDETE